MDFIKKQTGTRIDPIIDSLTLGYLGSPFREDIKFQEIPNFEINKIVVLSPELTIRLEDTFDKAIESVGKSLPPTIINAIKLLFSKLYQDSTINIRQTIIQFLEEIG